MRKSFILLFSMLLCLVLDVWSQAIPSFYQRYRFLTAPSSVFQEGLVGFANPANTRLLEHFEGRFFWDTDGTDATSFNNWGIFTAFPHAGFGVFRQNFGKGHITDYRISTGMGSEGLSLGLAYGWTTGNMVEPERENLFIASTIFRPFRYLSLGLLGNFSVESHANEGVAEIGIRPFGTPRLTLFADGIFGFNTTDPFAGAPWSAGGAVQLARGINLVGRYFESEALTIGLTINFGTTGIGSQIHYNSSRDHAYNSYMVRLGGRRASVFQTSLDWEQRYLSMNLKGRVDYLSYAFFDHSTHKLIDLLHNIRAAAADPRVEIIALNLSGMRVLPEHAWEIREALTTARRSRKKVIVFIDNVQMTGYHLASVANKIVLDPQGSIMLPGYLMGRTYFKGTLEKMGLGFDEWRFFKYKSAAEPLSRRQMSEADAEQRQAYLDDWYELTRADVSASRAMPAEDYDRLIDEDVFFIPQRALEAGLVDTLGRWPQKEKIMQALWGRKFSPIKADELLENALPSRQWGAKPKIALVYGLGVCAVDEGIRARWLEKVFLRLKDDRGVKAVVFRVDSPGGDGMASDMVAEAIRKCKEKKPVIISQGQVAASGGYWISMYGDQIVAAPNTITGSIGVIGGWIYDRGIGEKLGMTSDYVKRGEHADLGFGIRLPLLGAEIPARNLTPQEREKMEKIIRQFYKEFVRKVARGRGMTVENVEEIARGHFYSGLDGLQIGLVDEIGGMMNALAIARNMAGIDPGDEFDLIQIPEDKGFINWESLFKPELPVTAGNRAVLQYLKMVSEQPGRPLPLLEPGSYPTLED